MQAGARAAITPECLALTPLDVPKPTCNPKGPLLLCKLGSNCTRVSSADPNVPEPAPFAQGKFPIHASWGPHYTLCLVLIPLMPPNQLLTLQVHSCYASWGANYTLMSSPGSLDVPKTALNPEGPFLLCKFEPGLQLHPNA